jgi:hypothetical protein
VKATSSPPLAARSRVMTAFSIGSYALYVGKAFFSVRNSAAHLHESSKRLAHQESSHVARVGREDKPGGGP